MLKIDDIEIEDILSDFKSIKLSKKQRDIISRINIIFKETGSVCVDDIGLVRMMSRRYSKQFKELYDAREKANATNWRLSRGITRDAAEGMIKRRLQDVADQKMDLGI